MSEPELNRSDDVHSSHKQLSVDSKDNSICRTKVADNESEITFKRCTSCTVLICYSMQWIHVLAL